MSDSDIQRLYERLEVLGRQYERLATTMASNHDMLTEVRMDVKNMSINGCSKGTSHADHEERIRGLETFRNWAAGVVAIISGIFGVVGGKLAKMIGG